MSNEEQFPHNSPKWIQSKHGKEYLLIELLMTFEEAKENCLMLDGNLPKIESQEENDFVCDVAKNQSIWLGIRKVYGYLGRHSFRGLDETKLNFSNWDANYLDPKASTFFLHDSGLWRSKDANEKLLVICERKLELKHLEAGLEDGLTNQEEEEISALNCEDEHEFLNAKLEFHAESINHRISKLEDQIAAKIEAKVCESYDQLIASFDSIITNEAIFRLEERLERIEERQGQILKLLFEKL